jgi:hypothetical protein
MVIYTNSLESSTRSTRTVFQQKEQEQQEVVVRQEKCQRSVQFELQEPAEVFAIPSTDDFTAFEKRAAWYQAKEISQMKADLRAYVRRHKGNSPHLDLAERRGDTFCIRGLEPMLCEEIGEKRRKTRRLAATAVLLEQEIQELEGGLDAGMIAEAYRRISVISQETARQTGILDAQAALEDPADNKR